MAQKRGTRMTIPSWQSAALREQQSEQRDNYRKQSENTFGFLQFYKSVLQDVKGQMYLLVQNGI